MGRPSRFSPEVRERSVRMVEEHREAHASEWAALQSVAPKLGCTAETLRKCVRQAQRDAGDRPGLLTSERERWTALEREVGAAPVMRSYALNAKGNFQFDRAITGWRNRPVLDLRLKK